jgi:hypothetical protein
MFELDQNFYNALGVIYIYIFCSWLLWKRTKRKMTLWFEVLFRILIPMNVIVAMIYFQHNWYIVAMCFPILMFWALTRRGKAFLIENFDIQYGNKLSILNRAGKQLNDDYCDFFGDSSERDYDIQEVMTKNAKQIGPEFYNECSEIINSLEGAEITTYYTWENMDGKFEYIKYLYLHKCDSHYRIGKCFAVSGVELSEEEVYDRKFRVFLVIDYTGDPEAPLLMKKFKHVLENAKMVTVYDEYLAGQDEIVKLKAKLEMVTNRNKETKDFFKQIDEEEKEEAKD